jgi:hypothetical protein
LTKIEPPHDILLIKQTRPESRERIVKAIREKKTILYKSKPIKITEDFSRENLKVKREWS